MFCCQILVPRHAVLLAFFGDATRLIRRVNLSSVPMGDDVTDGAENRVCPFYERCVCLQQERTQTDGTSASTKIDPRQPEAQ